MPIGFDPSPVACPKNKSARIESRGISSRIFPVLLSRYIGMNPSFLSIPDVFESIALPLARGADGDGA